MVNSKCRVVIISHANSNISFFISITFHSDKSFLYYLESHTISHHFLSFNAWSSLQLFSFSHWTNRAFRRNHDSALDYWKSSWSLSLCSFYSLLTSSVSFIVLFSCIEKPPTYEIFLNKSWLVALSKIFNLLKSDRRIHLCPPPTFLLKYRKQRWGSSGRSFKEQTQAKMSYTICKEAGDSERSIRGM